jgi:hypothetical protein
MAVAGAVLAAGAAAAVASPALACDKCHDGYGKYDYGYDKCDDGYKGYGYGKYNYGYKCPFDYFSYGY